MGNDSQMQKQSDNHVAIMLIVWVVVFAISIFTCSVIDVFVLHPIAQESWSMTEESNRLSLVRSVYPDAEIIESDTSVLKVFYIQTGDELHLLVFQRCPAIFPVVRYAIFEDTTIPQGYTGTIHLSRFGSVVNAAFTDGVFDTSSLPISVAFFDTAYYAISIYCIISLLPATIALLPTWFILKARKKKTA